MTTITIIPKAFGIGTVAGILGSMAGMGGGFVMIPLMTSSSLLRLSQHQAHGTSLAAVTATGLAGAVAYGLDDQVHVPAALAIAGTAVLTARWGAQATQLLSGRALKRALGVLLLIMGPAVPAKAYYMEKRYDQHHHLPRRAINGVAQQEEEVINVKHNNRDNIITSDTANPAAAIVDLWKRLRAPAAIGIGSGFLAGLFGVGGGTLVVPALTIAMGDDEITTHHQALATSLAAMTLPAAVGTWTHARAGNVAVRVAPPLALGALCGAYVGGKWAVQTDESVLRWGFSALLTVLGIRTLWKA